MQKLLNQKKIEKNRITYHKMLFEGKQGIFKLKFLQYYWIINKKAYILTFTSEINKYEKYFPIAKKIFDSFKIIM